MADMGEQERPAGVPDGYEMCTMSEPDIATPVRFGIVGCIITLTVWVISVV